MQSVRWLTEDGKVIVGKAYCYGVMPEIVFNTWAEYIAWVSRRSVALVELSNEIHLDYTFIQGVQSQGMTKPCPAVVKEYINSLEGIDQVGRQESC